MLAESCATSASRVRRPPLAEGLCAGAHEPRRAERPGWPLAGARQRVPAAVQRGRTPTAHPRRRERDESTMPVLERSELEASPLADLHAIADQLGLDGFRRLRKADLIDAILGEPTATASRRGRRRATPGGASRRRAGRRTAQAVRAGTRRRRCRAPAARRGARRVEAAPKDQRGSTARRRREDCRGLRAATGARRARGARAARADVRQERGAASRAAASDCARPARDARVAEGVVELLGNGSAFLRVDPPEPPTSDVYISAAQVRRCELVSGDRVAGPVRARAALRALPVAGPHRHDQRRLRPTTVADGRALRRPAGRLSERAPRARRRGTRRSRRSSG